MRPPKHPDLAAPSTRKWWSCPGVVYFLGVGNPVVAVKIGMLAITEKLNLSSAIARRLAQIQTSNHEPVEVLGVMTFTECEYPTRTAEITERELHKKFSSLARFKSGTKGSEWFNSSPLLLEEIKNISAPPESLGIPRCLAILVTTHKA